MQLCNAIRLNIKFDFESFVKDELAYFDVLLDTEKDDNLQLSALTKTTWLGQSIQFPSLVPVGY